MIRRVATILRRLLPLGLAAMPLSAVGALEQYCSDDGAAAHPEVVIIEQPIMTDDLATFGGSGFVAQYTRDDYSKKRGWGHSCYLDTVNAAADARIKDLYLFHVDPNYDDDQIERMHKHSLEIIKKAKSKMRCHVAREGMQIDLGG